MHERRSFPGPIDEAERLVQASLATENEPWHQMATPDRLAGSRKVTDHLANERTFLAWIRTALAVITFGAALGRFGGPVYPRHLNGPFGWPEPSFCLGGLVVLGVGLMLAAFCNFLRLRQAIEHDQFQQKTSTTLFLTILSCLTAGMMALYLLSR